MPLRDGQLEDPEGSELIGQRAWLDRRNWLRRFVSSHYKAVIAVVLASVTSSVVTVFMLGIRAPALMATMNTKQTEFNERLGTLETDAILNQQISRGVARWLCQQDRPAAVLTGIPCGFLESDLGRR